MELTIEQALQQAVEAHNAGKLQDAEALYKAILQAQPKHPDANHHLGVMAVSLNKTKDAVPFFKIALEANPYQEQFYLSYIDALIKEQQFEDAKNLLDQGKKRGLTGEKIDILEAQLTSILLTPNSEFLLINNPLTTFQQLKKVSSKKEKKKSLFINLTKPDQIKNPPQIEINNIIGFYQNSKHDLVQNLAKSLTQKYPNHLFGWKVLGASLQQTGKLQESVIASQKVLEISPNDAEAHYKLGITLKKLGRLEDAAKSYKKAIAIKPDYAKAHSNLGYTLEKLGRLEDAAKSYKKAIGIKPDLIEAHFNLGNTLKELGRLEDAAKSFEKAVAIKPDLAEAHSNLGNILQELGKLEDAAKSFEKAIAFKPDYAEAHSNLSNTLQELGRLEDAATSYKKAIAIKPDYALAHYNLGITLKKLGRLEDAEASYKKAIAINPDLAEAHSNLGITLQELGRLEDAEISYKRAIAIKPDYAEAFSNLSLTLLFLDKLNEATQVLLKIMEIDPEGYGLKACVDLAVLNFLSKNRTSSKSLLIKSKNILTNKQSAFKNQIAYWNLLSKLLDIHQNVIKKEIDELEVQKLYVIGESHSLASHDTHIKIQSHYLCQSFWIVGCKQWHLGNTFKNKYKYKFQKIIQGIPSHSNILLSIGEIDCRINNGILNQIKKNPVEDKIKIINSTINNYLQYIFKLLTPFSHNITIQGVPCPNIIIENKSKEDFSNLVDLVKQFNVILKKQSHFYGFNFLDLHKLTDRGDGFSNGKWHIDQHHLSPAGMQEAWRTCFTPHSA
jgi:tetratricopeptide (TPR) repeat protein